MTFIYNDNNDIISFAEFEDVLDTDQRVFDTNEGLSNSLITPWLEKSTDRIVTKITSSSWWQSIYKTYGNDFDINLIIAKQDYFSDLCVYYTLSEFILPYIADFGNQDTAEYQKILYYQNKFAQLFEELLSTSDWYDVNEDGNITIDEIKPSSNLRRRVR